MADPDVAPAGLGARDSLRLEAGLPLYGSDIDETTTPVEAGLAWAITRARRSGGAREGGFPGAGIILKQLDAGARARRVGLRACGRRAPRARAIVRGGAPLYAEADAKTAVGAVTSGGFGPSLDGPIAMGYVPAALRCARNARLRRASRQAAAFDRDRASLHHAEIQARLSRSQAGGG